MKPTQEQIKEFWEGCGMGIERVRIPDPLDYPKHKLMTIRESYPLIDLNTLFKYAVPKLELLQIILQPDTDEWYCGITTDFDEQTELYEASGGTPAEALFWAIYKVMK